MDAEVLSGALPPLCKVRWVGVSRAGGVVFLIRAASPHDLNFTSSVSLRLTPSPQGQGKGADEIFALNQHNFTLRETLRFMPLFRYRAPVITVSVSASVRR